jgi:hypothetical protein
MKLLFNQILQIHDCLDIICNVEKDIFDGNLRGLFRKKDYAGNLGITRVCNGVTGKPSRIAKANSLDAIIRSWGISQNKQVVFCKYTPPPYLNRNSQGGYF